MPIVDTGQMEAGPLGDQVAIPAIPQDYFQLAGQVALVTGASSGLGRHFSLVLAGAGMTVGLAARRTERLSELATEIEAIGGKAVSIKMDVTDGQSIAAGFDRLVSGVGTPTVLVNNAGVAVTRRFLEASDADVASVLDTNVRAAWNVAQRAAKGMVRAGVKGSIINIASVLGLTVAQGVASYAVSKAAVIHMTKAMALELARHDIRVNAIAPGYFETDMNREFLGSKAGKAMVAAIPMRRVGDNNELSAPLLLLASPRGSYMTGSVILVDGGWNLGSA